MGQVQKLVMGDDYGCQNLELSSNDPFLCGCCDYHKHFHVRLENDIPNLDHIKRNAMASIVDAKVIWVYK